MCYVTEVGPLTFGQHADNHRELDPQTVDGNPGTHGEQGYQPVGHRRTAPPATAHGTAEPGQHNKESTGDPFDFVWVDQTVTVYCSTRCLDLKNGGHLRKVPAPSVAFRYTS